MAALTDATYYTNQVGTAGESGWATAPKAQNIYYVRIPYVLAGTEAAADTLNLFRACKGWKLIPELSKIIHDDCGTTLTIDIGDATDPDRYADGVDLAADDSPSEFCTPAIPDAVPNPFAITDALKDIVVTIATAASVTESADVVFVLAFDIDTGDIGEL
jgi:hypothetical protein